MSAFAARPARALLLAFTLALLLITGGALVASAHDDGTVHPEPLPVVAPAGVAAACSGGPTIDGQLLDECIDRTFTVGGTNRTVRVWYTKVVSNTSRMVNGSPVTLQHWITADSQAQQVAAWFEDAWQRYFADSGHDLYQNGCSRLNVQMEDGVGWSGIAYWGSPGNCSIGIDSPMVRGGGGQWTVYHEAQHYLQYSYDAGCYGYLKPNYPDDSEFVEGYADLGADSVDNTLDASGYGGSTYNSSTSMYDKSYGNIFNKYFVEQLGTIGTPADSWHHMDALYNHYAACDAADNLYVLNTLIPSLKPGMSEQRFFLNFFAANWAKDWADPATQPELVYTDDDGNPYGSLVTLKQNVSMAGGTQSWADTTPDDWAANYYQVTPQTGCPYLQMSVDGAAGAQLGINLMAAKTSSPTKVLRSAFVGEDYVRTFAAAGVNNLLVAGVNSFANNYAYTVDMTCVTPTINILEPLQTKFALVGDPASPISFLARWEVKDGTKNVRGLPESSFTFLAGTDPISVVPGTFQEVGDEYWAVLLPPVKPAGTTFVNFTVNLGTTASDSETNALLYVNPGNTNVALSFDASGSMATEDAIGEGTRLANAQKAAAVIADLLRVGDRILVQDWSATDSPAGCGLPGGSGNCPLDVRTLLTRSDATAGNLSTLIGIARAQINAITARAWTPVGGGLRAAKDALKANPGNTNPNHIYLLSDGEENVNPLYASVKDEIKNAGVVVNTIGFGPEAPGNLLAQIAADTGGIYRPVATDGTGSGMAAAGAEDTDAATAAAIASATAAMGASADTAEALAATFQPGQLGLANVYDYFDTEAQGASRIINANYKGRPAFDQPNSRPELSVQVDKSVNQLRLVVAGKQPDQEGCPTFNPIVRRVEVFTPDMKPQDRWIPVSPRTGQTPAAWDIRNNTYDDVLVIDNPMPGTWKFRTYYILPFCGPGMASADASSTDASAAPANTTVIDGGEVIYSGQGAAGFDFMMNVSVQSTIQLEGRLLGLTAGQGEAGDSVNIVGYLLDKNGLVPPTAVLALIEGPNGDSLRLLQDNGLNGDGSAGDGIFGMQFNDTAYGGGYSVRLLAGFKDPADPTQTAIREWNGGFWIKGPRPDQTCGGEGDADGDCMPDSWERRCKLNLQKDDRNEDPDHDGLTNIEELKNGTLPCRADTDKGGENDGSEVAHKRDPLNPADDKVRPLGIINVRPLNNRIIIQWTGSEHYTRTLLYLPVSPDDFGRPIDMGQGNPPGHFELDNLPNDQQIYVVVQGVVEENGDTFYGDLSQPKPATPKADPDMPSGAMLINNGAEKTNSPQVVLYISATDEVLPGAAQGSAAHKTDMLSAEFNTVSGGVQMRLSNSQDMAGAVWQPLTAVVPWTLACDGSETCTVYAQFRDAAGNESLVVNDFIQLEAGIGGQSNSLFMPLLSKQ